MITYRYQVNDDLSFGIIKVQDGIISHIPNSSLNYDWVLFQEWLNLGNTPEAV